MQKIGLSVPHSRNLKKLMLIVKFYVFILLVSLTSATATVKATHSQNVKFTFNLENIPIKDFFNQVEKTSEFIFVCNDNNIDLAKVVTVKADNETIEQILEKVFTSPGDTYTIDDRQIVKAKVDRPNADIGERFAQ